MPAVFDTEKIDEATSTFREFITFFRDLIIILLIVILIRVFLITPFRINGTSMEESYHENEYILVDKLSYLNFPDTFWVKTADNTVQKIVYSILGTLPIKIGDPERGDVVVLTPHVDKNREYYIKRIIAIPGDTIRIENGNVYIKTTTSSGFVQLQETYLSLTNSWRTYLGESIRENQFTLQDDQYWAMGDNRQNSSDSRTCFKDCYSKNITAHFIKRSDIIGHALLNFWYLHIFHKDNWAIDFDNIGWVSPPRFLSHPRTAQYPELQ